MNIRIEVICSDADSNEQRREVLTIERQQLAMETLGMSLSEGKALLAGVQDFVIAQQAHEYLEQQRPCAACGRRHTSKDSGSTPIKTLFGAVSMANPRWNCCPCQAGGSKTFRPMRAWLQGRVSPEMVYLEAKWALVYVKSTQYWKSATFRRQNTHPHKRRRSRKSNASGKANKRHA